MLKITRGEGMYRLDYAGEGSQDTAARMMLPEQRGVESSGRRGMVISVNGPGPSSAATLNLASYLGTILKKEGKNVCVVELNFRCSDVGKYLNVFNPNVTHLARDRRRISAEELDSSLIHRPDAGIAALLGPPTPMDDNPQYINPQLYAEILPVLKEKYDYVFLNAPSIPSLFSSLVQEHSDSMLVPLAAATGWRGGIDEWLQSVNALYGDKLPALFLLGPAPEDESLGSALESFPVAGTFPGLDHWDNGRSFELLSMKNIPEVNQALSSVLYNLTGERALLTLPEPSLSRRSRLLRLLKR